MLNQGSQGVKNNATLILGGITAFLFGLGSIFAKQLSYGNSPIFVTLLTHVVALGSVFLIFILCHKRRSPFRWDAIVAHWKLIGLAGVLGLGLPVLLAIVGFMNTNVIRGAILLQFQTPIALVFGGIWLREHVERRQWVGIGMVLFGGVLAVLEGPTNDLLGGTVGLGDLFLLGAALCFGMSFGWVKQLNSVFDIVTASMVRLLGSVLFLTTLTVGFELQATPSLELPALGNMAAYAITNFVFGSLTLNAALRRADSWRTASILHLSPIITIAGSSVMLQVYPSTAQFIGVLFLICGNIWIELFQKNRE